MELPQHLRCRRAEGVPEELLQVAAAVAICRGKAARIAGSGLLMADDTSVNVEGDQD
jgi:hypothetical protein